MAKPGIGAAQMVDNFLGAGAQKMANNYLEARELISNDIGRAGLDYIPHTPTDTETAVAQPPGSPYSAAGRESRSTQELRGCRPPSVVICSFYRTQGAA